MGGLLSRFLGAGIAGNILNIILNTTRLILSRSLDIEITNHTRNITLRNPRTYLNCGHCSVPPLPELSPGSQDTCRFPGRYWLWGVAGVLVYEAESFTLAIHFCNPINYFKYPRELGLELSPGRAHLGSLEDTYNRMANSPNSASRLGIKFNRAVIVDRCSGIVQVSDGPITVRATMSSAANSILRVVLDKRGGSGEEVGRENSC